MTTFLSLLAEAWQELRIHKLRVLLSLIGVGVAVSALTLVVALGSITERVAAENMERLGGRAVTLSFQPPSVSNPAEYSAFRTGVNEEAKRFGISYVSATGQSSATVAVNGTPHDVTTMIADPDYRVMRQQILTSGRWLEPGDEKNMSPPVVVSTELLDAAGITAADLPMTITGPTGADLSVVGVVTGGFGDENGTVYFLPEHIPVMDPSTGYSNLSIEMWVPEHNAKKLEKQLGAALQASLGVDGVSRSDYAEQGEAGVGMIRNILLAISGIIMGMGVLGMINIAVVTIQQRIREIGIRRSFGATPGRVFFSVMMESVVGTFVAGLAGVSFAILVLRNPLVTGVLFEGISETPPFPLSAAIIGMVVAVAVGGLAGLIPALVATRIRIIDAIRT